MKNLVPILLLLLILVGSVAFLSVDVEEAEATLNRFRSYGELVEFLQRSNAQYGHVLSSRSEEGEDSQLKSTWGLTEGFSETNVQVEGVDEADIVKTDGEYIYLVTGSEVLIAKAYPAEDAAVVSRLNVNGNLKQIFINEEKLVLFYINGSWSTIKTFIDIYDVSIKEEPIFERNLEVDGFYFDSRMIGEYVYAIIRKDAWLINEEVELPRIYSEGEYKGASATDIYYSHINDYGYTFTTIVAVNVQTEEEPAFAPILSGYASELYVSLENIYIAMRHDYRTIVHRIHINDGQISYVADGQVPGSILNQFSMDEHEGYFRIATTSPINQSIDSLFAIMQTQNNAYVLNMDLDIVGKLEKIAPGESIHSVRFMGDTCYLVTFRKVDPFFVIDLSDPYSPTILGELKITGYSDYLHPYDQNHVIGIGKETVGAIEGDFSWYQGVKISLFDVTDVSEPEELAKFETGDRGTDSPVLTDHKAFLFDRERNLMVIPVAVAEIEESQYPYDVPQWAYGDLVWQGAYVFTISLTSEEKIALIGTITHVEGDDVHNTSNHIVRTLYIGEVLYTISQNKIKMTSLFDLSEINELNLNG